MTVMYHASVDHKDIPSITKFTQHGEVLIGYPPDCAYFETFEAARGWLKERTWERYVKANDYAKRMRIQYNEASGLTVEDIK